jgi:hypothetical protein
MRNFKIQAWWCVIIMYAGLWAAPLALAEEKPQRGGVLSDKVFHCSTLGLCPRHCQLSHTSLYILSVAWHNRLMQGDPRARRMPASGRRSSVEWR